MSELPTYALTTLARVKDRLGITSNGADVVLERIIASATDYIEAHCNRRFKRTSYTNELHMITGVNVDSLHLRHAPVTTIASVQYRTGLVSNPTWTSYTTDDYELLGDGKSGIVVLYGTPVSGANNIRVSYTAGYLIDFANPTDTTKHTLPYDLTDLCERLVVKIWRRRESEGKTSEVYQNGQVTWGEIVDKYDRDVISTYQRVPQFF